MTGYQNECATVYGTNIGLNAGGIGLLGIEGAAFATAISTILWNAGLYWLVIRRLGIFPSVVDGFRSARQGRT